MIRQAVVKIRPLCLRPERSRLFREQLARTLECARGHENVRSFSERTLKGASPHADLVPADEHRNTLPFHQGANGIGIESGVDRLEQHPFFFCHGA